MRFFCISFLFLVSVSAFGQQQQKQDDEALQKQLRQDIDKIVENYEASLKLEDWQVFYLDSILVHDYNAMTDELKALQEAKVSNVNQYTVTRDKWNEKIYNAVHKILNEEQWAKYLKTGAAKEKKLRDKRAAEKK